MATEIDAARLLVYRAAWLKQDGPPHTAEGAKAKLFASEMARRQTARGDPGPRRLRLHEGVPGRALLPRREDHRDLRGHERDPAARDRAGRASLGAATRAEPIGAGRSSRAGAQPRRARPADAHLHARRRRGRDEPRRRVARVEARLPDRRVRRGRRAELARSASRSPASCRTSCARRSSGSRTSSSTSARTSPCPCGEGDGGCASRRSRSTRSSATATASTPTSRSCGASSCPAGPRRRRGCTSRARSAAGPSASALAAAQRGRAQPARARRT